MNDGSTPASMMANTAMAFAGDGTSSTVAQAIPMQTMTGLVAVATLPPESVDAVGVATDTTSDGPAVDDAAATTAGKIDNAAAMTGQPEASTATASTAPAMNAATQTIQATGQTAVMQAQPAQPVIDPSLLATNRPATTTASTKTAEPGALGAPTSGAGAVGGTVLALLLVVGLILAMAWLAKRMPGVSGATNPNLKLIGSLALGPRERVVVVEVGGKQLLLSTGAGGTRTLHTLDEPLPAREPTQAPAFALMLARQLKKSTGMGKA